MLIFQILTNTLWNKLGIAKDNIIYKSLLNVQKWIDHDSSIDESNDSFVIDYNLNKVLQSHKYISIIGSINPCALIWISKMFAHAIKLKLGIVNRIITENDYYWLLEFNESEVEYLEIDCIDIQPVNSFHQASWRFDQNIEKNYTCEVSKQAYALYKFLINTKYIYSLKEIKLNILDKYDPWAELKEIVNKFRKENNIETDWIVHSNLNPWKNVLSLKEGAVTSELAILPTAIHSILESHLDINNEEKKVLIPYIPPPFHIPISRIKVKGDIIEILPYRNQSEKENEILQNKILSKLALRDFDYYKEKIGMERKVLIFLIATV